MDREQPHRVGALLLGDSVPLDRADGVLLVDEADEALDVRAAQLLVRAGEPGELAQVRVAAPAVRMRQHGQVVVVVGDDPLAEPLEREPSRRLDEPVEALPERPQELRVALRADPAGTPRSMPVKIGRRPAARRISSSASFETPTNGRGEHADERLVVVAVVQEAEVGEQIDDLLLAEVAAAGRAIRRQADRAQLLLVPLRVRPGREQEHDLARRGRARVDQLAHAARDVLRLGAAPVDAAVRVGGLVRHEQLDRDPEDRIRELAGRGQGLELVAELGREEMVDDAQHLGPRAVVARQRQQRLRLPAALAEHPHVRMPEAVDRLELVADEEALRVGAGEQVDELALEPVRVLELVHHEDAEAQLLRPRAAPGRRAGGRARAAADPRSRARTRDPSRRRTPRRSAAAAPAAALGRGARARRARPAARPCAPPRRPPRARRVRAGRAGRAAARAAAAAPSSTRASAAALRAPSDAPGSAASASAATASSASRSSRPGRSPSSSSSSRPAERRVS